MKDKTTRMFDGVKIVALAVALSFGISYLFAWTSPTAPPPENNVSAPINMGSDLQEKSGPLVLNALKIKGGNPGAGKVLTSNATGDVSWTILPPQANYSKTCAGDHSGDNWFSMFQVPQSFTIQSCKNLLTAFHSSYDDYKIGCIFDDGTYSFSTWTAKSNTATPPNPNCGW